MLPASTNQEMNGLELKDHGMLVSIPVSARSMAISCGFKDSTNVGGHKLGTLQHACLVAHYWNVKYSVKLDLTFQGQVVDYERVVRDLEVEWSPRVLATNPLVTKFKSGDLFKRKSGDQEAVWEVVGWKDPLDAMLSSDKMRGGQADMGLVLMRRVSPTGMFNPRNGKVDLTVVGLYDLQPLPPQTSAGQPVLVKPPACKRDVTWLAAVGEVVPHASWRRALRNLKFLDVGQEHSLEEGQLVVAHVGNCSEVDETLWYGRVSGKALKWVGPLTSTERSWLQAMETLTNKTQEVR